MTRPRTGVLSLHEEEVVVLVVAVAVEEGEEELRPLLQLLTVLLQLLPLLLLLLPLLLLRRHRHHPPLLLLHLHRCQRLHEVGNVVGEGSSNSSLRLPRQTEALSNLHLLLGTPQLFMFSLPCPILLTFFFIPALCCC